MGRPAKSLELHRLHGTTPSKSSDATVSKVPSGRPRFPKGLTPDARVVFKRLVNLLETRRACTEGDVEALRLYAHLYQRHAEAIQKLDEQGVIVTVTVTDNSGNSFLKDKKNLWLEIAQKSEQQMLAILKELGLTPRAKDAVKQSVPDPMAAPAIPGSALDLFPELFGLPSKKT